MKRYCRTYKINDENRELYAFVSAKNEEEAENLLDHDYQSKDEKEYEWTSGVFEVSK